MMRNKFDEQLSKLNRDLTEMGHFIEETINKTMSAFKTNNFKLAEEVAGNDDFADELEMKVERRSLSMLLSQQPVARDLRIISTALKMITDMERICDQAQDISEIMLRFDGQKLVKKPDNILQMSEKCVIMVNGSIDAFIKNDLELARSIIDSDDEIDDLFVKVRDNITAIITQDSANAEQAIDFMMIAKYLERMGDHAVNIAEWVVFSITGEHKDKRIL